MEKVAVSLVIITLNEEPNIARAIGSVPWADEVIVVDSGSTDKTVSIAQSLGAKVITQKFAGFRAQKQSATDLAKNNWVLSLDADESLSPELSNEILQTLKSNKDVAGFSAPRLSFHLKKWIKHGGWYPDRQLRLFDKTKCHWTGGEVHEKVLPKTNNEKIENLKNNIQHLVFKDLNDQVETNNKYSSLGAQELFKNGKRFSYLKLIFKPISKFVETYILKMGFLDGGAGFVISVGAAYSVFLKFAKLKELYDRT